MSKQLACSTISAVRRQAGADRVNSWGGDRIVVRDDGLAADLASVLGGAPLDIAVDSVGPAATALAHHLDYSGTLIAYGVQSASAQDIRNRPKRHIYNYVRCALQKCPALASAYTGPVSAGMVAPTYNAASCSTVSAWHQLKTPVEPGLKPAAERGT